jgi:hypothetical protein
MEQRSFIWRSSALRFIYRRRVQYISPARFLSIFASLRLQCHGKRLTYRIQALNSILAKQRLYTVEQRYDGACRSHDWKAQR